MDLKESKKEEVKMISIFATERLEDYMALSLAALIMILVLLLY